MDEGKVLILGGVAAGVALWLVSRADEQPKPCPECPTPQPCPDCPAPPLCPVCDIYKPRDNPPQQCDCPPEPSADTCAPFFPYCPTPQPCPTQECPEAAPCPKPTAKTCAEFMHDCPDCPTCAVCPECQTCAPAPNATSCQPFCPAPVQCPTCWPIPPTPGAAPIGAAAMYVQSMLGMPVGFLTPVAVYPTLFHGLPSCDVMSDGIGSVPGWSITFRYAVSSAGVAPTTPVKGSGLVTVNVDMALNMALCRL